MADELASRANQAYRNANDAHVARDSVQERVIQVLLTIAEHEHCARTQPRCRPQAARLDTLWSTARTLRDRADTFGAQYSREREHGDSLAAAYRTAARIAVEHMRSRNSMNQNLRESAAAYDSEDVDSVTASELTDIAERFRIVAKPRFISRPRDGGVVLFQTFRARERRDPPTSLPETTNTRPQEIPIGCYYFWIQRGSIDTSDRNRAICVTMQTEEIVLSENPELGR